MREKYGTNSKADLRLLQKENHSRKNYFVETYVINLQLGFNFYHDLKI